MSIWGGVEKTLKWFIASGAKTMESDVRRGEKMLKNKNLSDNQRTAIQNDINKRKHF